MLNAIPLKCPNCGANLNIVPEMTTFACGYCGASQMVKRSGGTVSLKLVTDAIRQVQHGTDRTAAELALKRLEKEAGDIGLTIKNLNAQKRSALRSNFETYRNFAVGLAVVCFIFCLFHIVMTVLSIIGCFAGWYFLYITHGKQKNEINDHYKVLIDAQHQKGRQNQIQIDKNYQIANS